MLITFAPSGETFDTAFATPQKGLVLSPVGIPYINIASGATPIDGTIASGGSPLYPLSGGPKYHLSFVRADGTEAGFFNMESENAITVALANIAAQLNAESGAITLGADGDVTAS